MGCDVNFSAEALNEDGSVSEIQPTEGERKSAIEALSKILDYCEEFDLVGVSFIRPNNKNYLNIIFDFSWDGEKSPVKHNFRAKFSCSGYTPSVENMTFITIDHLMEAKRKAAE